MISVPILPMKCLVIAVTLTCANVHAKGVAAIKAQSYHADSSASVFVFESVESNSAIITFDIKGQKPYSITKSDKLAYVEVIGSIGDITDESEISPYRNSIKECEVFASKYTKSQPLLTPYIEMISGVVGKYESGMVKKDGEWIEKYLLASKALKPKDSDPSVKWKTLTLDYGKTYQNVSLLKKMPHQISILHDGGAVRVPYEHLTSDTQKELGGFDPEKAAEARKRDSEAKQLDAVRYTKADKILKEKQLADLAKQKEINKMRQEKKPAGGGRTRAKVTITAAGLGGKKPLGRAQS